MLSERLKQIADGEGDTKAEAQEMARELLSLRWRPITPEDLPAAGRDEVCMQIAGKWLVSAVRHKYPCSAFKAMGAEYFRPVHPPDPKATK